MTCYDVISRNALCEVVKRLVRRRQALCKIMSTGKMGVYAKHVI
jgi:hypothetical protein